VGLHVIETVRRRIGVALAVVLALSFAIAATARADAVARRHAGPVQRLHGIPETGSTLGHAGAPVSVTLYGDLECPICREFLLSRAFSWLVNREVRNGRAKITYRAVRTATPTMSVFETQQAAALAAGRQGLLWQFSARFLLDQGRELTNYVTPRFLARVARHVPGLNYTKWAQERDRRSLRREVQRQERTASRRGIFATPTLIIRGPHGASKRVVGVPTIQHLKRAIDSVDAHATVKLAR
jgi:protein-disulfide isomerase